MKLDLSCARSRAHTLCQTLIVISIIIILMGLMTQGLVYVHRHGELTALTERASQLGTALHLFHQDHRTFPDAYPADLEGDLADYVDEPELFVSPADPGAGAEPLNRSYVTPVLSERNTYVLSFLSSHDKERAVVLFADSSAEIVEKLPVLHNDAEVDSGSTVTGGSLTFAGGSAIELSDVTSATVVQSFRTHEGTPVNVMKVNQGVPASLTAVAVDASIVEIAAQPGVTLLRGGVGDVEITQKGGEDLAKVSNQSGEVIVNGKLVSGGQLVGDVVDDYRAKEVLFAIDEDHTLIAQEDCIAKIQVLGKAITYGAGGPDCAVQAGAKIADEDWGWLFDGAEVYGGEVFSREVTKGTRIAANGRASYGSWSREYKSTRDHRQVLVLINGDTPPEFAPFDGQPEITDFCSPVIDPATGKITIEPHQALILFELGTTNMHSPAADFQDLVLLVDFARITNWTGGDSGDSLAGRININPNNNNDFEFALEKADGGRLTRDDLHLSNRDLEYTGPVTLVRVKPKGNGNQNSLTVNGVEYPVQNGRLYTITGSDITAHLYNDKDDSYGQGMGRWWIELSADNAAITAGDAPVPSGYPVTLGDDNVITVHEDCSVGLRVLGTDLRKSSGKKVPIALKLKLDHSWKKLHKGRKIYKGYKDLREVDAGTEICLKAISYWGSNSASYHSADGSGHVLTVSKNEVPDRFDPSGDPPELEDFMTRVMDGGTRQVRVGDNQFLILFELGQEDVSDPDARFQDVAVVLTFTPQALHSQNEQGDTFDGYVSKTTDDPVGPAADAYAAENNFDWAATREADLPQDDGTEEDAEEDVGGDIDDGEDDGYTESASDDDQTTPRGCARGILGRGTTVKRGRWITVTKFH